MSRSLFNFPRQGNLRRLADRLDAAKHRNTRRAIAKTVEAIVGNRTVDALLREAAQPPVDLDAKILKAIEADLAVGHLTLKNRSQDHAPIQDISQYGSTFCTLHRITTVGNFCSACEHEAAQARVPVSKAAKPAQASPDVTRLVTAGGNGGVE